MALAAPAAVRHCAGHRPRSSAPVADWRRWRRRPTGTLVAGPWCRAAPRPRRTSLRSPIRTASSRRALASVAFDARDRPSPAPRRLRRGRFRPARSAPASTRRCNSGVSRSMAATCSSRIWIRRCSPSTLRKAIAVSDSTSSRTALRWIAAASMPACPGGDPRVALAEQLEDLADLQRRLGRLRAAIDAGTERIVLFVGQFRIEQRTGLDAPARRDADVALRRGQPRACGERARQRGADVRVCECDTASATG